MLLHTKITVKKEQTKFAPWENSYIDNLFNIKKNTIILTTEEKWLI